MSDRICFVLIPIYCDDEHWLLRYFGDFGFVRPLID